MEDYNPKHLNKRKEFKGVITGNTIRRNPNYLQTNNPNLCKWIRYRKINDKYIEYKNGKESLNLDNIIIIPKRYTYCTRCDQRPCRSIDLPERDFKKINKTKARLLDFACQY